MPTLEKPPSLAGAQNHGAAQRTAPYGGHSPRVDFMCVGVQKAATTWLYESLARHPEIVLGAGETDKDTAFFSCYYDRGYEWYEQHFAAGAEASARPRSGGRFGEVSTSYFPCRDAPARIARYNPRMQILLCLRNPVDRVVANHLHEIRLGHISRANYALADGVRNNPSYVEQSRYGTLLERWLMHFPLEQIHILVFEHLFENPEAHLEQVYRRLHLSPAASRDFPRSKVNEGRVPLSHSLDRLFLGGSRLLRRVGLNAAVDHGKRLGIHRWVRRRNSDRNVERHVDDATLAWLDEVLREETVLLTRLTGRDFTIWSR